jgi:hypothetical protein
LGSFEITNGFSGATAAAAAPVTPSPAGASRRHPRGKTPKIVLFFSVVAAAAAAEDASPLQALVVVVVLVVTAIGVLTFGPTELVVAARVAPVMGAGEEAAAAPEAAAEASTAADETAAAVGMEWFCPIMVGDDPVGTGRG